MKLSFRVKTILGIALIEAIVLTVLISTGLRYLRDASEQQFRQRAATTADLFATATKDGLLATDLATLSVLAQELLRKPGVVYARVRDRYGRALAEHGAPDAVARVFVADDRLDLMHDDVFDVSAAVREGGVDYGQVEIGFSIAALQEAFAGFTRRMAAIAALGIALAALFSFVLGTYLTQQIVALRQGARRLAEGEVGHQLPVHGRDELAETAQAFNTMSQRLAQTHEHLQRSEQKFRSIYENAVEGIYQVGLDGRVLGTNPALARMLGYASAAEMIEQVADVGKQLYVHPEERTGVLAELLAHDVIMGRELEFFRKDGRKIWVSVNTRIVRDENGNPLHIEGFMSDITVRKQAEERIQYLARHDALTGLPNRLLFQDRVAHSIAQAHRDSCQVAVLFIDLDHFKHVNDSLGHPVGDKLLRSVSRRLQGCLREGDSVARLGGDEFVISLPRVDGGRDAALVAQKTIESLKQPLAVDGHELHVTASIGISLYPIDGTDPETLMRTADTAMYHAKEKGRNNYQFFTSILNQAAHTRLTIANRLHHALDRGEFSLYYQPQIDIHSGRVTAIEALLRWQQPEVGLILPAEFIHIAEETGLIVPLGEWVLRQACCQLKRWRDNIHPELRVAVNLSPHQLQRPNFFELTAQVLAAEELAPTALELELTESTLMSQSPENVATFEQLARLGVQLAVDDFGTGYASLSYLQRFPIHTLKIDRSFVDGIGRDANDTAIVSAVIAMAQSLHLKVVAEGVETAEQAEFLQRQGCSSGQGYFYGAPMPADTFDQYLRLSGDTATHRESLPKQLR